MDNIDVYLEAGKKRVFASALEWPGWCRSGRSEEEALQSLIDYSTRYDQILRDSGIEFQVTTDPGNIRVVERVKGNASTDFGAPAVILDSDRETVTFDELARFREILHAGWRGFDSAVLQTGGKELKKGPRGGGRELEMIQNHVLDADKAYLTRLAWKFKREAANSLEVEFVRIRQAIKDALTAAVKGELPEKGPRGGALWPPRYFVRRVAWHLLDHTWEIEDRIV